MDKQSAIAQLDAAYEAIDKIDLRGRRKGTVFHDVVVAAKESVAEAYDALVEDAE